MQSEYQNVHYDMQDKLQRYPQTKQQLESSIDAMKKDLEHCKSLPIDENTHLPAFKITLDGTTYTDRTEAGKALESVCCKIIGESNKPLPIGELHGFPITIRFAPDQNCLQATLQGSKPYTTNFSVSFPTNLKHLESLLFSLDQKIAATQNALNQLNLDAKEAEKILAEPFASGDVLREKSERLTTLRDDLNQEAMEAAKSGNKPQRTFYFEMAKLKKNARTISKSTLEKAEGKKVFLMGGGIGVPPILELAKQMKCEKKQILAGYRDAQTFLKEEFEANGELYISTEDGSVGTKGNVMDAIRENGLKADMIYACGPTPMLRAIKQYAEEQGIECYISLEERMACGIGACLACVCRSKEKDAHSNVNNKRICKDGPVFLATEVEI